MSCSDVSPSWLRREFWGTWFVTTVLAYQIVAGTAEASPVYTLSSGNSSASIDLGGSSPGMKNWTVDGQNQLNLQWFWYRVGSTGPDAPINNIGPLAVTQLSSSILDTTYASSPFSVEVLYSLLGGAPGSGVSDMSETIKIQNLTGTNISFHFFQYADFNLGGTPNNDSGQLSKTSKGFNEVDQNNGFCQVGENVDTVVSHPASRGAVVNDNSILNSLNDGGPTTLNNSMSAYGNVKWGLEWDFTLAPGSTYLISKDLNISGVVSVPEPDSGSLVLFGLLAGGLWKLRSNRRVG